MKRLVKKSSQLFIHATGLDRLESILNQGLTIGKENGKFTSDSLLNGSGIYVSELDVKSERLASLEDFGSVLLELTLDTNNMIPDLEYFNISGPHPLSTSDMIKILDFIVQSDLFQQKYLSLFNIDDYEDIEEFVDEEYDKIAKTLFDNNFELARLIKPGMFYEISDYVYLGDIPSSNIQKVYIKDENSEIHEFDSKDTDQILEFTN